MKRHFARILTALLLLALLPGLFIPARAVSGVCGPGAIWEYDEETATLTISGQGPMEEEFIDMPWERFSSSIRTIIIKEGVRSIGAYAFIGCSAVREVQIPASVREIGEHAFTRCESLESIVIPEGVTKLRHGTFSMCDGLKTVTLPNSLESIGYGAFEGCDALETVEVPEGLKEIGNRAFYNCESLKNIRIPWSAKTGFNSFTGCTKMRGYWLWLFRKDPFWNSVLLLDTIGAAVISVFWVVSCVKSRREDREETGAVIPWGRVLLGILAAAALVLLYLGLVWLVNLYR